MIIFLANLIGAILAYFAVAFAISVLEQKYIVEPSIRKRNKEYSAHLGLSADKLYSDENRDCVYKYLSERYSTDKLSNRIADFAGLILKIWAW